MERISHSDFGKYLSENKPFIFCPKGFMLNTNMQWGPMYDHHDDSQLPVLCKLAKEYDGRIVVGRGDLGDYSNNWFNATRIWNDTLTDLVREWCEKMDGTMDGRAITSTRENFWRYVYRNKEVLFFAKGKLVDVLDLRHCNEAVFRHWIETETPVPEKLYKK